MLNTKILSDTRILDPREKKQVAKQIFLGILTRGEFNLLKTYYLKDYCNKQLLMILRLPQETMLKEIALLALKYLNSNIFEVFQSHRQENFYYRLKYKVDQNLARISPEARQRLHIFIHDYFELESKDFAQVFKKELTVKNEELFKNFLALVTWRMFNPNLALPTYKFSTTRYIDIWAGNIEGAQLIPKWFLETYLFNKGVEFNPVRRRF